MKYNTYTILVAGMLMLFLLPGCEKMVEIDPPTDQINTAAVFEDTHTAEAALANLMAEIRDNSMFSGGSNGLAAFLSSYTDELDAYFISNTNAAQDIYHNQQLSGNISVELIWRNAYKEIYMANSIAEGLEKASSIPVNARQRIAGTALLVRSMIYFNLQRLFGDVPYTETTDFTINKSLQRMPENQVLDHLEKDLLKSAAMLADEYTSTERLYPNRKVAQLVLAEVYLSRQKWAEAEQMGREVVSSPMYSFEEDVKKVFLNTGKHILWQMKPQNENDGTAEALQYYFTNAAPSSYALSADLMASFSDADLRKQFWTLPVSFNGKTWYRAYKYKNLAPNTTEYSVLFRLEEGYCILAEAVARQGKIAEAAIYLNRIRQRAGLAAVTAGLAQDMFFNELLEEKRREFFTEKGQRFFDLKRIGKLQQLTALKSNWKPYHRLWPIPLNELLLNPNLNPQNEGY
ncbi:RagB/SusD family nutrient uptake outer membrane protein [Chryseobacterium sp. StRB126]|uniref:RagB/SusD family nutrient uptake outer membrane protein n=1 Tax=Chryseobacterium sp. StRB126 TaxID=878220 RepID=UPI0005F00B8E|nr:RagB/SusD family nutrient uptake outer membrane protein [Chryseobacterium sp. StRB126]